MLDSSLANILGSFVAFILTLLIFSYVFGDNVFFRISIHVFIGVAAGYIVAIAIYNVFWPQLILPLMTGSAQERLYTLIPFGLGLLLLTKVSSRLSVVGTPVMAFLVGIGAAAAIGGAIYGTLFPQALATMNVFDTQAIFQSGEPIKGLGVFGNASIMLVGTLSTLAYFNFGSFLQKNAGLQRPLWLRVLAWIGQFFISLTFGVLFAGVYTAALMAMIERWNFIVQFILSLFSF